MSSPPSSALSGPAIRPFEPGDEAAITAVIDAALPVDNLPGITRQDLLHGVDRMAGTPESTLVALDGGRIVGYCTPRRDELAIHPAFRRRGHGRRLVEAWLERLRAMGEPELTLYGPADRPETAAFIAALGFTYRTSLWMFELDGSIAVPRPAFPADVTVRTYEPDDLAAVVALANATFADHPTPLRFDERSVGHANSLPDFDPSGILLVFPADEPTSPVAWTKASHELDAGSGCVRGLVAFIGVLPAWRGRGLGRELLRWAIAHGRDGGAGTVELAVEAANERALTLYRASGFVPRVEWPHFGLRTGA